jgi:hypothetical protein
MKRVSITLALLLLVATAFAQPERRQERMKALRIAYFTEQLALTPEEATVFWPIYNAYAEEIDVIRKKTRLMRQDVKWNFDTLGDAELTSMADEYINLRSKEAEIQQRFHPKFKTVLSSRKLVLFYKAENEFSVWLIRKLKEMRQE